MKKTLLVLLGTILLSSLVIAQSIDIEFPDNNNLFQPGDPITFKVTLYDNSGSPIDGQIKITITDSQNKVLAEKTISSKEITTLDVTKDASSGQGVVTAELDTIKTIAFFDIGAKEGANFELDGNLFKVTNVGNTQYKRKIEIKIGDTVSTQEPNLGIGESVSYRLIAPKGNYNIKISDGKTSLIRSGVALTGTGQAIGAIDESSTGRSPLTGIASPDEKSDIALLSYMNRNKFVYVFVAVVFAAMILIAIERRYKKKAS